MARAAFVYTDDFLAYHFGDSHPFQQRRLKLTRQLLDAYGHFGDSARVELVAPAPARSSDLLAVHDPEFTQAVLTLSNALDSSSDADIDRDLARRHGLGPGGDTPAFAGMWEASLLYVGASLECADRILSGRNRAAFNPSGGLHHAMRCYASGFCIFNDCALVAKKLIDAGRRVACLDVLDAHHGDGTQEILYEEPEGLTISFHETGRTLFPGTGYPNEVGIGTGAGYSVNVPMEPASSDEQYIRAFDEVAAPILAAYRPDVIVLVAGTDAHFEDPLAHLALTSQGWMAIVEQAIGLNLPIIALGSGGYNVRTAPRLYAMLQAALAGTTLPGDIPEDIAKLCGVDRLHDMIEPPIMVGEARRAARALDDTIRAVREAVFPYHGLSLRG
jgi:acetoin utilization protein AcuC